VEGDHVDWMMLVDTCTEDPRGRHVDPRWFWREKTLENFRRLYLSNLNSDFSIFTGVGKLSRSRLVFELKDGFGVTHKEGNIEE
jgi:hypothetical protein